MPPCIAYLDCHSGISGDMFLGAMLDAGFPLETLRRALAGLPISGYELKLEHMQDKGIRGARFEPCGLGQLIAMRYGSVPIVRKVGGLADTVQEYDPRSGLGNGFIFDNYDPWDLFAAIVRALELFRFKDVWRTLQQRGMEADHSWHASAMRYVDVYRDAIAFHKSGK